MDFFKILNIIGLTFDALGVLLMFLYTPKIDLNAGGFLPTRDSFYINEKTSKQFNKTLKFGIFFILIGFILQIISAIFSE